MVYIMLAPTLALLDVTPWAQGYILAKYTEYTNMTANKINMQLENKPRNNADY